MMLGKAGAPATFNLEGYMAGRQRIAQPLPAPKPVSLAPVSILAAKHKFTAAEMREGMILRGLLRRAEMNGAAPEG